MNTFYNIFSSELVEAIGWTLVHSLWQGSLVAILLAILLLFLRRNSAQVKYFISFITLFIMLGWSAITFMNSYKYAKEKSDIKENITSNPDYIKNLLVQSTIGKNTENIENKDQINLSLLEIRAFFQRNFNGICTIWLIGIMLLTAKMIGGFIYVRRLRTYQLKKIGDEWLAKIDDFARKLKIDRKVEAFFSPLANVPITLGTIKPMLLFPVSAFTGLSTKDIEAILAHELAHVLRHDYFFNIIQSMVEILFFYHPAIWIISAQIRNERENSCDNIAIELTGDKVAYVKALAQVQINQMEQGQLAMAFALKRGSVLQRIKRLQKQVAMKTNFIEGLIAAGVIVVGFTLVSFTMGNNIRARVLPNNNQPETEYMEALVPNLNEPTKKVWTVLEVDSIRNSMEEKLSEAEKKDQVSEELERVVEVALSEQNHELSAEIMEEINAALSEINVGEIIKAAMHDAQQAINEINYDEIRREMEGARKDIKEARRDIEKAKAEIDYDEINRELEEARREIREAKRELREDMRRDMENDNVPEEIIELSIKAAEAGLNIASSVVENLPIDDIIDAALSGVGVALEAVEEIDFDKIFDGIKNNDSISEKDIERLKEQLEQREKEIEAAKEKIKEKEKELKKK